MDNSERFYDKLVNIIKSKKNEMQKIVSTSSGGATRSISEKFTELKDEIKKIVTTEEKANVAIKVMKQEINSNKQSGKENSINQYVLDFLMQHREHLLDERLKNKEGGLQIGFTIKKN